VGGEQLARSMVLGHYNISGISRILQPLLYDIIIEVILKRNITSRKSQDFLIKTFRACLHQFPIQIILLLCKGSDILLLILNFFFIWEPDLFCYCTTKLGYVRSG
jgi:hypothetical protein